MQCLGWFGISDPLTAISMLLGQSMCTSQEQGTKTVPPLLGFPCGEGDEMHLDGELAGLTHMLPHWQWANTSTRLPYCQRC